MYYVDVAREDLDRLREGLGVLEKLSEARSILQGNFYIYGLTSDAGIVDAAKEAIAAMTEGDVTEEQIQLAEVCVIIPLSGDNLYYLTGSGIKLQHEEFVYMGTGGEGARTSEFAWANIHPMVNANQFSQMAVATSELYAERFLRQQGTKKPATVPNVVNRTPQQPATIESALEDYLGD